MKNLFILLCLLLLSKPVLSEEVQTIETPDIQPEQTIVIKGNIEFDWLDITQVERDAKISEFEKILFDENTVLKYNKKEFKKEYKDFLKDDDYKRHYMLVREGVKETDSEKLCGFYRGNLLIVYAIQYKDDLKTVYYYDALGKLRYIDKFSENYPDFPYTSKQYRTNGSLVSAIYVVSHDLQYMYNNDQSFNGVWYKNRMYDSKAKQILTRTNW